MVKTGSINLNTRGFCDVTDITPQLEGFVNESGISNGIVTVFVPGATGGLTTIEFEGGLVKDFNNYWEKAVPEKDFYNHNERWDDGNGFSHIRASLLGPSITIPFVNGKMTLGIWQQVIFVDFDNRSRSRRLVVQVMGE